MSWEQDEVDQISAAVRGQHSGKPICDVCSSVTDRYWVWIVRAFGVVETLQERHLDYQQEPWYFCVMCRPLWEQADFRCLAARADILAAPWMPREFVSGMKAWNRNLYEAAHAAIQSGPTLLEVKGR